MTGLEDITYAVAGPLLMASYLLGEFARPRRGLKIVCGLMLLAALVAVWKRVYLPIPAAAGDALLVVIGLCWIAFLVVFAPRWYREIRDAARG